MRTLIKTLLISSVLALTGPVFALQLSDSDAHDYGADAAANDTDASTMQGGGVSLGEAVEQVRRQYKGRIISAVTKVKGDREVHEIKVLLESGKVKTVNINGKRRG